MSRRRRRDRVRRGATAPLLAGAATLALASFVGQIGAGAQGNSGNTGVATTTPTVTTLPATCSPGPVPATTTTTTSTTTTSTTTTSTTTTTTTTTPNSSTTTVPSATTTSVPPTTTTSPGAVTTTTVPTTPPQVRPSYDLLTSSGDISTFGGAISYGSKSGAHLNDVVAGAITVDGAGYWFTTAKGGIYNFGDASFYGSAVHDHLRRPIVAMAATPDGEGYWLAAANGAVYNFGDAPSCGSAIHHRLASPVTAIVATSDGAGYWLICADGVTYGYGDAGAYGVHRVRSASNAVVAAARTSDGLGYWTLTARGAIFPFGDAAFYGSAVHRKLSAPAVSIGVSPTGHGYWIALANGRIYNFGDAPFDGSLAHHPPPKPATVVAILPSVAVISTTQTAIPHHVFGYDVSNYQCAKTGATTIQKNLPTSSAFTVIEVAGLLDSANDSCLAALASWASTLSGRSGTPYELYLFMNSPGTNAAAASIYADGPKGACANESGASQQICIAYNYGYNGAKDAYAYASGQSVRSSVWWLDVEGGTLSKTTFSNFESGIYWGSTPSLNADTIQGAIDALRQEGVTVGIYSTSVQFPIIAGAYVPSGGQIPLWVAGVPLTNPPYSANYSSPSVLASWCAGTGKYKAPSPANDLFAGGIPWLLQETPGAASSPYGLDPDYSC